MEHTLLLCALSSLFSRCTFYIQVVFIAFVADATQKAADDRDASDIAVFVNLCFCVYAFLLRLCLVGVFILNGTRIFDERLCI